MTHGSDNAVGTSTKKRRRRQKSSIHERALDFLKEWGGVATVLIAILYTFPFDAASRFISWREHNIIEARRVLSEVSALYAEEVTNFEKIQDLQLKSFLANSYNIRIYNRLSEYKSVINKASTDLLSSELYMIGSFYTLSGLADEGIPYYQLALAKSKKDPEKAAIYRELGNALFIPGPNQNISGARDAYNNALRISSTMPYVANGYAFYVTELGGFELTGGDWKCGQDLTEYGLALLDLAAARDASAQLPATYFRNRLATLRQGPTQPATGCPYKIPKLAEGIASPSTTPPPVTWPQPNLQQNSPAPEAASRN
jgi:tetratricopeptide (TPR) repeat protein